MMTIWWYRQKSSIVGKLKLRRRSYEIPVNKAGLNVLFVPSQAHITKEKLLC